MTVSQGLSGEQPLSVVITHSPALPPGCGLCTAEAAAKLCQNSNNLAAHGMLSHQLMQTRQSSGNESLIFSSDDISS